MEFQVFTRSDLSYNNYIKPANIINEYNTILLPKTLNIKYKIGDKISIKNKKKKFNLTIILANSNISMLDIDYNFFHFAPSLLFDESDQLELVIDNQTFPLYQYIDTVPTCKIINGLLLLDNNYYDNFNNNDKIEIYINNKMLSGKLIYKQNKYNLYRANIFNTILHIMPIEDNLDIIYSINNINNKNQSIKIRSLDTLFNHQKGSIVIKSKNNQEKYLIKCKGVDNNYYGEYYIKDRIEIKNLSKGRYTLEFLDNSNNIIKKMTTKVNHFIEK